MHLVEMCFEFWDCTVMATEAQACAESGPGVDTVLGSIALILYLQTLVHFAFRLLPYSGKFDPRTGKVSYRRSLGLLQQARDAVRKEAGRNRILRQEARAEVARRRIAERASATQKSDTELDLEAAGAGSPRGGGYRYDRLMDAEEIDALIEENKP